MRISDWSSDVCSSDLEADVDLTYNADIFTIDVATKAIAPIPRTRGIEIAPRWSPDGRTIAYSGLTRKFTSSESHMEPPHVWTLDVRSEEPTSELQSPILISYALFCFQIKPPHLLF